MAVKVCQDLGLPVAGALTGTGIDRLDDAAFAAAIPATTVFARVSPGAQVASGPPAAGGDRRGGVPR
ncbi:hypothetical protein [Dactylosporangium salmoneum]|uniref:hypothetical protein n=1 Tax=Dactylosporangium salmoneum TaxID=53361 RepID=UPI0031D698A6